MEGEIIDEEDEWIGVKVTDDNRVEHKIAVEFDGEIRGHGQDGYPDDATEREYHEDEAVSQARRYARWYVARETDHDPLPWDFDPDRFETVRAAVADLPAEALERYFGAYFSQLAGHGDGTQPRSLPADADPMNPFRQ